MSDRPLSRVIAVFPALRQPSWHVLARTAVSTVHAIVTRRYLRDRKPRLLADISLSQADAVAEAARALEPGPRRSPRRPQRNGVWGRVREMWRTRQSRQRITELDARLLKDIGVTYTEAEREANKPFWR